MFLYMSVFNIDNAVLDTTQTYSTNFNPSRLALKVGQKAPPQRHGWLKLVGIGQDA